MICGNLTRRTGMPAKSLNTKGGLIPTCAGRRRFDFLLGANRRDFIRLQSSIFWRYTGPLF